MQTIRIATLSFVALLVAIGLAFWWAGFAPFPTEPALLASYQTDNYCTVPDDNWARCSPGMDNPYPVGSAWHFRLFPKAEKTGYGEYNQWGVEGYNGCWDAGCLNIFHEQGVGMLQWKIYYDNEVPHFGLGKAKWVVIIGARRGKPLDGVFAETAFTTYGACMYRKPADTNDDWYRCEHIDQEEPWKVGTIHELKFGH